MSIASIVYISIVQCNAIIYKITVLRAESWLPLTQLWNMELQ